jgi:hypothetical protein
MCLLQASVDCEAEGDIDWFDGGIWCSLVRKEFEKSVGRSERVLMVQIGWGKCWWCFISGVGNAILL